MYKGEIEQRIRQVLASGVRVTLNSDDPAYFGRWAHAGLKFSFIRYFILPRCARVSVSA